MSEGLFNPEAFEQMPGQMSMEQVEPVETPRNVLERVRGMFPVGAVVECVENTYIPARNGTRRVITKVGKSYCEGLDDDGKPYYMNLPKRVRDVVDISRDSVTYKLRGPGDPARLEGHTVTFKVIR